MLALGDAPLEAAVLERVVLGVHGEVVAARVPGQAPRQRPGQQHAVVLQPQVPVEPPRVMLVDDEPVALGSLRPLAVGTNLFEILNGPVNEDTPLVNARHGRDKGV